MPDRKPHIEVANLEIHYGDVPAVRGEDPKTAGRWMLAVRISERTTSSSHSGLEFTPPAR